MNTNYKTSSYWWLLNNVLTENRWLPIIENDMFSGKAGQSAKTVVDVSDTCAPTAGTMYKSISFTLAKKSLVTFWINWFSSSRYWNSGSASLSLVETGGNTQIVNKSRWNSECRLSVVLVLYPWDYVINISAYKQYSDDGTAYTQAGALAQEI
jgi:hypothetical protein